ncbi:MAG: HupE/UreJ family protein [Myxococcota bacterium]
MLALVLCGVGEAAAHTRSVSYASWLVRGDTAEVRLRIPLLELSRLAFDPHFDTRSGGRAALYLAEHVSFYRGELRCVPVEPPIAETAPKGWAHFFWRVRCDGAGPGAVESRALLEVAPSHMHFARVAAPDDAARERVLTEADSRWTFESAGGEPAAAGTTLLEYVVLGVEHIVTGWDHLAFVLALLLLARRVREVAALVTSFTLAHSVTLGLAVLGWVRPDGHAVEALIGYSIALVAAENAWLLGGRGRSVPWLSLAGMIALGVASLFGVGNVGPVVLFGLALFTGCHFALLDRVAAPGRLRAAVAFAFGLVHGFGFAGVLAEMALPANRLVPALFGFNVGVELGQLAVVALAWPLLLGLSRWSPERWAPRVAEVGSAAVCGLGLFWFITRTLG